MKTKKISFIILAVVLMLMVALVAVACNENKTPSYTVTLDARNGEATASLSTKAGGTVTLPTPTVDGANFLGWFTEKDGAGDQWTNETPVNADVILYAAWALADNAQKITVTFDLNGVVLESGAKTIEVQTVEGLVPSIPDAPTRNCYVFNGWFDKKSGGNKIDPEALYSKNTTVYAQWLLEEGHVHDYSTLITVAPTCEKEGYGYHVCACGAKKNEKLNVTAALGHDFDFTNVKYGDEDDYFEMVVCRREGCDKAGRRESDREFDDVFVYNYDETKQTSINAHVETLNNMLDPEHATYVGAYTAEWKNEDTYDEVSGEWTHVKPDQYNANKTFEQTYYDVFYDDLKYLTEQYQVCYVYYCVNDQNAEWKAKYEAIQDARTNAISTYYALFRKVYNTKYREYFFSAEDGWTEEDIEKALTLSDSYGGGEYAEIKSGIDAIEVAFRDLADNVVRGNESPAVVQEMYKNYVDLNNRLATLSGYDNYVDYAYENVYDRDYTPEEVAELRVWVKQYLVPIYNALTNTKAPNLNKNQTAYKNALLSESIFDSKLTADFVEAYLKEMKITDGDGNVVQDYYAVLNELFKVGNYFPGKYSGAFNYWIEAQQKSALYFGPGSYSGAFTFVHEFGHYNNSYYNHGTSMSFDLDETHSQGNEMMFLAYLSKALPDNALKAYDAVKLDQLTNMLWITMVAMAVDEFEQAVYTNTYEGFNDGIPSNQYDNIFSQIIASYGISSGYSIYWRYVCIESACYYISYSTSAMASLQLYALAMEDLATNGNLDATRAKYYKLITFTDDDDNAHTDFVGDRVVDIGFGATLKYAGLYSIFEEDYYQFISSYFTPQA